MNRFLRCLIAAGVAVLGALEANPAGVAPTLEQLTNMDYRGIFDHPVRLQNGRWEDDPFVAGGTSRPAVGLVDDFLLTGDLDTDGQDEAVVLLWESSGGSGTYNYIAVVGQREGTPFNLGTALIGDRVQVRSGRIAGNRIELDVVQPGPNDAACCPSQKAMRFWTFDAAGLHVNASKNTGTLSLADLAGPEWVLNRLKSDEPLPAQPEITLVFDGERIAGQSACNRYFAGVKEHGAVPGDLTVSQIGSTRMACPEEVMALETRYLEALGSVSSYRFLAGKLALTWRKAGMTGTILFVSHQPRQP